MSLILMIAHQKYDVTTHFELFHLLSHGSDCLTITLYIRRHKDVRIHDVDLKSVRLRVERVDQYLLVMDHEQDRFHYIYTPWSFPSTCQSLYTYIVSNIIFRAYLNFFPFLCKV